LPISNRVSLDAANAFSDAVIVPLKKYTAPTGAWRGSVIKEA
jgi:hypothetical protein